MKKKKQARKSKTSEIPRFHISLAKLFQNLAYICLFVGCLALIGVVVGLIITYWPQSDSNLGNDIYQTNSGDGWNRIQLLTYMLVMYNPAVIVIEIIGLVLAAALIIWSWKLAVRTMRRLTWRLADEIMKPLRLVEPIFLLTVWALAIVGVWFLTDDGTFWAASVASLLLLVLGLFSLLAMRKLAGNILDFTRAELVLGRRWHKN
jgi:hypothetical protein